MTLAFGDIANEEMTLKKILAIAAIVTFSFWIYHKFQYNKSDLEQFVRNNWPQKAAPVAPPRVANLDARVLASVNERVIATCANNTYGLTEMDCVQTVNARKDLCRQLTVQAYPEQPATLESMQIVIASHVNCLFQNATLPAS